jgi:hypothetical protein
VKSDASREWKQACSTASNVKKLRRHFAKQELRALGALADFQASHSTGTARANSENDAVAFSRASEATADMLGERIPVVVVGFKA